MGRVLARVRLLSGELGRLAVRAVLAGLSLLTGLALRGSGAELAGLARERRTGLALLRVGAELPGPAPAALLPPRLTGLARLALLIGLAELALLALLAELPGLAPPGLSPTGLIPPGPAGALLATVLLPGAELAGVRWLPAQRCPPRVCARAPPRAGARVPEPRRAAWVPGVFAPGRLGGAVGRAWRRFAGGR